MGGSWPDGRVSLLSEPVDRDHIGPAAGRGVGVVPVITVRVRLPVRGRTVRVATMGGELDFESQPGFGTRFWFTARASEGMTVGGV